MRFGYVEREWAEGAPPVATAITVTARSGGRCVVRMVHSLFASTDDWDDQLEGFEGGWPGFFEVLRLHLKHFASMKAASFLVMTTVGTPHLDAWKQLTERLALSTANAGEERTTPQTPEKLSGIVERVEQDDKQRYVLLRLNRPAPGIALIGTYGAGNATNASMAFYLYGDDAKQRSHRCPARRRARRRWARTEVSERDLAESSAIRSGPARSPALKMQVMRRAPASPPYTA